MNHRLTFAQTKRFFGRERGNTTLSFAFQLTVDSPDALDFITSYAWLLPIV